jgi:UDP-N-acetylmuramoylalanine--D-glutamate ligase
MKRALVLGLGLSGKAVSSLLLSQGYRVTGADAKPCVVEGVEVVSDSAALDLAKYDLFVPSPGIPLQHPHYVSAIKSGICICGEAGLALPLLKQPMVAITGTNGKTTVTMLVTHVLQSCGRKAKALGNIGDPLSNYALNPNPDEVLVIELSSYQLETIQGKFFHAAAILNITPDHLDRHKTMRDYAIAKWRLQHCLKDMKRLFVYQKVMEEFADLCEIDEVTAYSKLASHDEENIEAAWLVCRELNVTKEEFGNALGSFEKPSHRIEFLGTINDVRYYDDSKGTNVDAVIRAVSVMNGPVWLIAGGVDKGASYALWKKGFEGKVKKIFAIGQAANKIAKETKEFCLVEEVGSLEEAVTMAALEATSDGNVLLSPGCSSFDMFESYAHRGREFQKIVKKLKERS